MFHQERSDLQMEVATPRPARQGQQPDRKWRITGEPGGNGDMVIVLPITTDCNAQGAVCTEDGRTEITVNGPGG